MAKRTSKKKHFDNLSIREQKNVAAFSFYLTAAFAELEPKLEADEITMNGAFSVVAEMMLEKRHTEEGWRELGRILRDLADGELTAVPREEMN